MSSLWSALKHLILRLKPETRLLLLTCIFLGLTGVILVPPLASFDAPSHYYRTLSVERGDFLCAQRSTTELGSEIPNRHIYFVETQWNSYWPARSFGNLAEWSRVSAEAETKGGRHFRSYTNTAVYHPFNYTFQAAGMGLSTLISRSPLQAYRMGCLFNLAGVMMLFVLCIELTPRFERVFLLFATMPLTMIQAASLSADGINFALPTLLLALVLRLREDKEPNWQLAGAALLTTIGICMLKPTAITSLACLVFIPSRHFGSRLRTGFAVISALMIGGLAWGLWVKAHAAVDIEHYLNPNEKHPSDMMAILLHSPGEFLSQVYTYVIRDMHTHTPHFYGDGGGWMPDWLIGLLPAFVIVFCLGLLGCPAPRGTRSDLTWSGIMIIQAVGSILLIALTLYLKFEHRGTDSIRAFSGRYHFAFMSCLALGLVELLRDRWASWRPALFWAAFGGNIAFLLLTLGSIGSRVLR